MRSIETRIARLTLIALAVFAPIETYASWQMLGGARPLEPAFALARYGVAGPRSQTIFSV